MLLGKAKTSVTINAVLTKADGTVIDLGCVGNSSENFIQRLYRRLKNKLNVIKQNLNRG